MPTNNESANDAVLPDARHRTCAKDQLQEYRKGGEVSASNWRNVEIGSGEAGLVSDTEFDELVQPDEMIHPN